MTESLLLISLCDVMEDGWNRLVELCCHDLKNGDPDYCEVENEPTLLKALIIKRLGEYYYISVGWDRCWPLKKLEEKCLEERDKLYRYRDYLGNRSKIHEAAYQQHFPPALIHTISDCLEAYEVRRVNMSEVEAVRSAYDYMMGVSRLAKPAYVRSSKSQPGYLVYEEPVFDPQHHRHPILTKYMFYCILDIIGRKELPTVKAVTDRFMFYEHIYLTFCDESWPTYLIEELEFCMSHSPCGIRDIFSRLLKHELDDKNILLMDLFHFDV